MTDSFSTQAEAITAARIAIWGDVSFAKREFVSAKTHPDLYAVDPSYGMPALIVSADVNGHLFVFQFDHYGREQGKGFRKVIRKGSRA